MRPSRIALRYSFLLQERFRSIRGCEIHRFILLQTLAAESTEHLDSLQNIIVLEVDGRNKFLHCKGYTRYASLPIMQQHGGFSYYHWLEGLCGRQHLIGYPKSWAVSFGMHTCIAVQPALVDINAMLCQPPSSTELSRRAAL